MMRLNSVPDVLPESKDWKVSTFLDVQEWRICRFLEILWRRINEMLAVTRNIRYITWFSVSSIDLSQAAISHPWTRRRFTQRSQRARKAKL
jgi:hypothetical protein